MIKFAIYLLESSAVLIAFYLLYEVFLKKETFFNFNRFYLLSVVLFSLLLPFMSFDFNKGKIAAVDNSIEEFNDFRMSYYEAMETWESQAFNNSTPVEAPVVSNKKENSPVDWETIVIMILLGVYILGVLVCLSKLLWTLSRLKRMISIYPKTKINGVMVVNIPDPSASFSFFGYAFIYREKMKTAEINQIIAHEKVHIEQRHSIDLIFVQLIATFLWFNPLIWKLIKSLKTTHEYIVDQKIINTGYSLVAYQTLLLRELVSNNSYGLVHNFNLSFIKKRIIMMTNNKSGFSSKIKMGLTVICTVLFSLILFQCNSEKTDNIPEELKKLMANNNKNIPKELKEQMRRQAELVFSISNNIISVDGKTIDIKDIEPILTEAGMGRHFTVRFKIDGNQNMRKLSEVQAELRRIDRRKVLYNGETDSGKQMIQPFIVPPMHWAKPSHDDSIPVKPDLSNATHNGTVATLDGIEYLKVNVSEDKNIREAVYNFVKSHITRQSTAYLIRVEYNDEDNFKNYLTNLAEVFQGFETVYKVRAQELYGKDHQDLKKEEYIFIGREAPKSVFIAGK
ncbi:M56 family metallopeptidase [Pontimicrobium sp. MEBiC06410]